jgi:UDP-glucose 4-epimerase
MNVLVTGGCGYIGSHQVVALIDAGHSVVVLDDLSRSSADVISRIESVTGLAPPLVDADVRHTAAVTDTLKRFGIDAIIHFAGFKSVPESTKIPIDYYDNNVGGLLSLLRAAAANDVHDIVFSSSASVYGETDQLPIVEDHPHHPSNPYSVTKSVCERILSDLCHSDDRWAVAALRYFNPAGAHPSGLLGEDPVGPASNLVPALTRAALKATPVATVTGTDFDTPDGTGVRDYVHVMDVAATHLRALEVLSEHRGFLALNIGRGAGVSVLDMVAAIERASGREFTVDALPRRPGDVSALYGDTSKSKQLLGPIEYRNLAEICEDAWRWESKHAEGRDG